MCVSVYVCILCEYMCMCSVGVFCYLNNIQHYFFYPHHHQRPWLCSILDAISVQRFTTSPRPSACRIPKHANFVASPTLISVPGYTASPIPDTVTIPGFATSIELGLKGKLRLCCDLGRLKVESNLLLYWVSVVFFKKHINKKNFAYVDALNSLQIIFLVLKWLFQWPWPMACFGVSDT